MSQREGALRALAVATGVAVAAMVMQVVVAVPVVLIVGVDAVEGMALPAFVALFVASYAGMAVAAWGYLRLSGRGLAYLDLRWPTLRDLLYVVGGTVGGFAALIALSAIVQLLGLPTTSNAVLEPALAGDTTFLLALVPLVLLINAPVEELVFRNVVQKRLYGSFGKGGAVVVASAVFALVHFPNYFNENLLASAVGLSFIFVGSLVFGWVYARTDNLVVPVLVHGLFNTINIALLYLYLTTELTTDIAVLP